MVDSILRIKRAIILAPTLTYRVSPLSHVILGLVVVISFRVHADTVQIDAAALADITRQYTDTWHLP